MNAVETVSALLEDTDRSKLENLAQEASRLTRQFFGRAIGLYTPLYLSNYCASHCTYCGFDSHRKMTREKLSADGMNAQMHAIAKTGVQNILLLTGESPEATPLPYLIDAVKLAKKYFQGISLEVFPMSDEDYRRLYAAGADGVTLYQETYDRARYAQVHLAGQKKDYDFRRSALERVARAGMRQISLGALLGLGPLAEDVASLYDHLHELEQKFPGVEYSLSFPRLQPVNAEITAVTGISSKAVDDIAFVKVLCLTRVLFPRVGINLSTREPAAMRNRLLDMCVTRVSIGSKTGVGGYEEGERPKDPQFDVADTRSAAEMLQYLKEHDFDPVFTDWRRIENA